MQPKDKDSPLAIAIFTMLSTVLSTMLMLQSCASADCSIPWDLEPGTLEAHVDGQSWLASEAAWMESAGSIQITTSAGAGWMLSLLAQNDVSGNSVVDAVNSGDLPMEVLLGDGSEGGWALLYPDEGLSFATKNASGGTLFISAHDADELLGCVEFVAADDSTTVELKDGRFRAALSNL